MGDLTLFHADNANAGPTGFVPRSGELVSAKFSADDAWYRAKVKRSHPGKKEAEVLYIDCTPCLQSGNSRHLLILHGSHLAVEQTVTPRFCRSRVCGRSMLSSSLSKVKPKMRRSALSRCSIGGRSMARTHAHASLSCARGSSSLPTSTSATPTSCIFRFSIRTILPPCPPTRTLSTSSSSARDSLVLTSAPASVKPTRTWSRRLMLPNRRLAALVPVHTSLVMCVRVTAGQDSPDC